MTLRELITELERADQNAILPLGFTNPHSYRGYYDQLAFEAGKDVPVSAMLADAKQSLGATFTGYRGGDYIMSEFTDVWIAAYGYCGEMLGPILLGFMLRGAIKKEQGK